MKNIVIILIAVLLFSCNHKAANDFIDLGTSTVQYNSVDEYLAEKKKEIQNDSTWIEFMFLNNPYNLNDWRKRSIPTHSGWLYPLTFDAEKGLKEA